VGKWGASWRIFRRCLRDPDYRGRVAALDEKDDEELVRNGAVRMLALLQEEGRLVDFLRERIDGYDDAQVGSAARSIHARCRVVLEESFELAPVLAGKEGEHVRVEEGFDPLAVRLEGNVGAKPPLRGILRHPGWRAKAVTLAPVSPGRSPDLVAPAEVEVV
jgi:hypothetical protein